MPKIILAYAHNLRPKINPAKMNHKKGSQPFKKTILRAAKAALADFDLPKKTEMGIFVVTDAEIRHLNRTYRHHDKTTNVLSFTMKDGDSPPKMSKKCPLLGDIVLAYETITKEARARHIPMKQHLTHLVIHGTLHLLGYDHESSPKAARRQEGREVSLLADLGFANPYE